MCYYVIMYSYGQFSKLTVYSTRLNLTSLSNKRLFLNDQEPFVYDTDQCN